jgi:hypothetical protein
MSMSKKILFLFQKYEIQLKNVYTTTNGSLRINLRNGKHLSPSPMKPALQEHA